MFWGVRYLERWLPRWARARGEEVVRDQEPAERRQRAASSCVCGSLKGYLIDGKSWRCLGEQRVMLSCSSIYSTLLLQLTKNLPLGKEQLISVRMISTIGYKFYKSYIHKLVLVLSCPPLWWVVLLLVCLCECRKVKKGTICQSYNLGKIIHLNVEINSGSASPNIGSSFGHPISQTSISRRYYSHNYEEKMVYPYCLSI